MGFMTAMAAVGTALGATGAAAAGTGLLATGSVVAGGVGAAAKGSSARKAQKSQIAAQAEENRKQREHELAMKEFDVKQRKDTIGAVAGKWQGYGFAPPLIRRETPAIQPQAQPAAPVPGDPQTGGVDPRRRF
jgi:hypothetical protein